MLAREEGKGLVSMVQALDERKRDWPSSITALLKGAGINKNLKKRGGKGIVRGQRKVKSGVPPNHSCRKSQGSN